MTQRVRLSPVASRISLCTTYFAKRSTTFHRILAIAFVCTSLTCLMAQTPTPVPVLTWRYDLTGAGQNTQETALTPTNVNTQSFGKLFALPVDSTVYAQPLYVPALKMSDGLVHNVVFVATENDSIYAFDADSHSGANAKPIWQISLLTAAYGAGAGATAIPYADTGSPDVAPTVGITGTPVINPATNTMYVVANTKENGVYFSRLHAINIVNGAEQANSPANITATAAGTGAGSSGGQITFSPLWQNQRTALNYYNGYVYFGYAAHGDDNNWHGWLFAYNATTLQQSAALCLTPNDIGGGLWGSGAGLPIDTSIPGGRMFVVTGNGARSKPPFNSSTDFGQSVIAFNLANGALTPTDSFTSFNYLTLNTEDWDQGAGGALMLPDQPGSYPHMLITAGKEGRITVLNRDNLGGLASGVSSNTNALQDISDVVTQGQGFWGTAAYWNENVYVWAGGDNPGTPNAGMQFKIINGVMDTKPDSQSTFTSNFPGPTFSISSNGTQDGIAWAVRADQFNTNGAAVLYAFDATDLSDVFYESDTNATRDSAGPANKFSVPVVTNGKVYVAAHGEVDVYGLLNATANTAAPVINPNGGAFTTSQSVQISSSTPSASIFYTLDGSTPTPTSTPYTAPIIISTDTTLNAIATATGYNPSSVSSATFTFTNQAPPITFAPAAGNYPTAQTVTLTDADANAKIYYTIDGSSPSASSTLYTGPIQVSVSETINAVAIDPTLQNSNVGTAAYEIQTGVASINFESGFSSTAGLTLNGSTASDNNAHLDLTNGGLSQAGSVFWNVPINIQAFTTTFQFQLSNAQANGFTFTIQNMGATALGGNSAGLGYQDIQSSVAVKFNFYNFQNEGSDSTGVYTDGQPPVIPSIDISPSGIQLASGDRIQATITYDGTTLTLNLLDLTNNDTFTTSQAINIPQVVGGNTAYVGFTGSTGGLSATQALLSWTYSPQSVPPVFAPPAGTYAAAQNVSLSSATSDAKIYYTTDGSNPTASSNAYSGPIAVGSSETINSVAISPTVGNSNAVSAAYVIQLVTAQPSFTLTGGSIPTIAAGGTASSTITVTPAGGFTGSVSLSCAITSSPASAVDPPTCSVSQPGAISGTQAATAKLTIITTGASTAALHYQRRPFFRLGEGTLAAILFLWLPFRRRNWQAMFGLLLVATLAAVVSGCGVSKSPTTTPVIGGTTAGAYAVTITGTSGSMQSTTNVSVTVQ
jgi:hypothetical protein